MRLLKGRWLTVLENVGEWGEGRGKAGCGAKWLWTQVDKGWKVLLGCEHMYMQNVSLV